MQLNDLKLYKISVEYEYDEGWSWDTNKMDIIASNDSTAIIKARDACEHHNSNKKDITITSVKILSEINLIDIYNSTGILNYYN